MTNADLFTLFRNLTILLATVMLVKYFIFLMLAAWYPVKEELRRIRILRRGIKVNGFIAPYTPGVSVVVPAWNEEVGIIKTIESVLNSNYPHIELVVVNDGSVDSTARKVREYFRQYKKPAQYGSRFLRHFDRKNGGKGKALNYGIEHSRGRIILTMDADSALAPDAIQNLVEYFRDPRTAAVVGQVRLGNSSGRLIGRMQRLEYLFGFYFKRAHCVLGAEYIYGGACAAFRRSKTFSYFGLFDEKNKTEDIEMSMRTKFHGLKSLYAEDVICYTEAPGTYMGLLNQRLRWKKGRFDTFLAYRQLFFSWKRHHNKPLSWFILPYALLSELQLLLEPIGATLLITYSVISGEFVSLALSMLFVGICYVAVGIFGTRMTLRERLGIIASWPFTWALFYIIVWVEFQAFMRSLQMLLRGDAIQWQNWKREGVTEV